VRSISDFETAIAIRIPIKNHSGKIDRRFSDQNRFVISGSKSDRDRKTDPEQSNPAQIFFIAITILVETMIRINQTLMKIFQPDLA
jgi:hypothetical protein